MLVEKKIVVDELVFAEIPFATPALDTAVDLRNRVLRIPLKLEFDADDIAGEWQQHHFGLFSLQHDLVACAILKYTDDPSVIKMRQVAVEPECQNLGIGKRLVDDIEHWCSIKEVSKITLHARDESVKFYDKLGYKKIGQPFEEVGLKHFLMEKILG